MSAADNIYCENHSYNMIITISSNTTNWDTKIM